MSDETSVRPGEEGDSRDGGGGSTGEPAPLQARAALLENWSWESVVRINERLCSGGRAQHGKNSETHAGCERDWIDGRQVERSLLETLDWLRSFHRKAPFLFFNGNTFAEIARTLTDAIFAELPPARRGQAASLSAHYVAGVFDREGLAPALTELIEAAELQSGDRVKTLRGSLNGEVKRILKDGRVAWLPDNHEAELTALPETLVKER